MAAPLACDAAGPQGLVKPLEDVLGAGQPLAPCPRLTSTFVGLYLGDVDPVPRPPQGIVQAILERGNIGFATMEVTQVLDPVELDLVEPVP
jgi:hypothetical protein